MKKSKILVIFMVLVMTLSVFAGCGSTPKPADTKTPEPTKAATQTPAPKKEKVIRFNNSVDPRTIDPAKEASAYEFSVENQMFEGLVRQSAKGIVPGIATEWKMSEDGLKYTFKLRDAKFSNG